MSDTQIIVFNPNGHIWGGFAVAERKDGRQYDIVFRNDGSISDVYAVGDRRKVSVWGRKIGQELDAAVTKLINEATPPFFRYGGFDGEFRLLEVV